ncbi:hypothetical protein [Gemmatimonas sp.]|uniref:hypothetical protein n=1 Tax=Gemmatimonas sp. TaxID=1962908 RepID=UPI0033408952
MMRALWAGLRVFPLSFGGLYLGYVLWADGAAPLALAGFALLAFCAGMQTVLVTMRKHLPPPA